MTVLSRLSGWLFATADARTLAIARIAVGAYGLVWLGVSRRELLGLGDLDGGRFRPVGIIGVLGFGPVPTWVIGIGWAVTVIAAVMMAAGVRYRQSGPAFAVGLLLLTSYQNSWGKLLHTENLLVLHALILATSPAADAGPRRTRPVPTASGRYGWPIRAMALATVLSYAAAGVAKLRHSGASWMTADNLGNWIAFDLTRKELFGDPYLSVSTRILDYGWLLALAAVAVVAIELTAPLALLGARVALPWIAAAWLMHVSVLALMSVAFPYHLIGIALLPILLVHGDAPLLTPWRRRVAQRRTAGEVSTTATGPR